jgi:hypothetical protein
MKDFFALRPAQQEIGKEKFSIKYDTTENFDLQKQCTLQISEGK